MGKDINFGENPKITKMAERLRKLYEQIMGTLQEHLVDALKRNDVKSIQGLIAVMEEAGREWIAEIGDDADDDATIVSAAQKALNNVLRQTQLIEELFNDDKTTVEEYEAFYNKLIASFIDEEVDSPERPAQGGKKLLPEETFTHNRKVLYKRVYTSDGTDGNKVDAIPNLHLLLWDFDEKAVMPITFSLHEALSEGIAEPFINSCISDEGKQFIGDTIMEFVKSNRDAAVEGMETVDDEMRGLHVRPSVVCPKPDLCFDLLGEAKKDAEINIADAFANINPADFAD
jgi:hypothetical protein